MRSCLLPKFLFKSFTPKPQEWFHLQVQICNQSKGIKKQNMVVKESKIEDRVGVLNTTQEKDLIF